MKSFCLAAILAVAASADGHFGTSSVIPSPTLEGVNFSATHWYKSSMNEKNEEQLILRGQYQMSLQDDDVFAGGDQFEFAICIGACTEIDIFSYD